MKIKNVPDHQLGKNKVCFKENHTNQPTVATPTSHPYQPLLLQPQSCFPQPFESFPPFESKPNKIFETHTPISPKKYLSKAGGVYQNSPSQPLNATPPRQVVAQRRIAWNSQTRRRIPSRPSFETQWTQGRLCWSGITYHHLKLGSINSLVLGDGKPPIFNDGNPYNGNRESLFHGLVFNSQMCQMHVYLGP